MIVAIDDDNMQDDSMLNAFSIKKIFKLNIPLERNMYIIY